MKTAKGTEYPISNKEYPMSKERKYDLQERLIDYAVRIIKLSEALPDIKAGKNDQACISADSAFSGDR